MIKLRDLITETVDERVLRLSKDGASKPFLKDFDRVFKKKSKEFGYGKLDKKNPNFKCSSVWTSWIW